MKLSILCATFVTLLQLYSTSASLAIGAIFESDTLIYNLSDIEIVFKHAIYVSNQYKLMFHNSATNYPTLLHKIIKTSNTDHLKNIKRICKDTNGNILGFIGYRKDMSHSYTKSLCEELGLLFLDISSSQPHKTTFSIYPSLDVMCKAYSNLINLFSWKFAAIIYDSGKNNMISIRCLLGGPSRDSPKMDVVLKLANKREDYRLILKDLIKRKITNIIVDLEPEDAQSLLRTGLQLGMISSEYHFLLTTLDIETMDMEDLKYNRVNLTAFRLVKSNSNFFRDISMSLIDYSSNSGASPSSKLLKKTENALFFDAIFALAYAVKDAEKSIDFSFGNISCSNNYALNYGNSLASYLEKVSLNGLTGHISFANKERRDFELDIVQLKEVGVVETGSWSLKNGINFTIYEESYEEIISNKGILKVATLIEEPYVMERDDGEFEGFCIDILKEIAKKMNFKYEIYKAPDNKYGTELPNGSWDGVVRELIEKRADLAVSSLTINYKRQQVVDFTKPFISLGISILFKIPTSEKPGLFSFLNPLSLQIWMYTLAAYLAVSFLLMVLARFSPYEWINPHPCDSNYEYLENTFTLSNSLWFALGTLMQQGSDINPKALSTRLLGAVWWFFTLIIISSYTANLAAFLTVERVVLPIQSVEDLANQQAIQYGTLFGGSTMSFFKESTVEVYRKIWKQMESNNNNFVQTTEEGIQRVLKKNYAFFMESTMIDYNVQKNCNLTQIGGLLDSKGYGIAAQRGSPYTDEISLKLLEMQEKGIIQQLYNKWWKGSGGCVKDEKKDSKANALGVQNVGGIFVVLVGGLVVAIAVSVCEFSYYIKKNTNDRTKPLSKSMGEELKYAVQCGGSKKRTISSMKNFGSKYENKHQPSISLKPYEDEDGQRNHMPVSLDINHQGLLILDNCSSEQSEPYKPLKKKYGSNQSLIIALKEKHNHNLYSADKGLLNAIRTVSSNNK